MVIWQGNTVDANLPSNGSVTDFELLLGEDNLEMIEDLEFYSWLEASELGADGDLG